MRTVATAAVALGVLSMPTVAAAATAAGTAKPGVTAIRPLPGDDGSADAKPTKDTGGIVASEDAVRHETFDASNEDVSKRTALSEESVTTDGARVVRIFDSPRFFDTGKGFAAIDTSVVPDSTRPGVFVSKANSWRASFASLGSGGVSIAIGSRTVSYVPDGAADVAPVVGKGDDANTVTYSDVWPGVDLVYHVENDRVKEDIVLHDASRSSFSFAVPDAALTQQAGKAGEAGALERTDAPVSDPGVQIAPPEVHSRNGRPLPAAKPTQQASALTATSSDGALARTAPSGSKVTVAVDSAWLKSLKTTDFPVVLDPTTVIAGPSWTSYSNLGDVCGTSCPTRVGNDQAGPSGTNRYWQTDVTYPYSSYMTGGAIVTGATLHLHTSFGLDTQYTAVQALLTSGYGGGGAYGGWSGDDDDFGPTNSDGVLDVTGLYQAYFANGKTDGGVVLSGEATAGYYSYHSYDTYLELQIDRPPGQAALSTPADGQIVPSTTPTLTATAAADPDVGDTVWYDFLVGTSPGATGQVWESGFQAGLTATVPATVLRDGVTYYWRVDTFDFYNWPQTVGTTVRSFHVDLRYGQDPTQPMDAVGGVAVNAHTGNVTTTVTPHTMTALGGEAGVELIYNSQATSDQGLLGRYWRVDNTVTDIPAWDPNLVRLDSQINFNWGTGVPAPAIYQDYWMTRWTGFLNAPTTGTYVFAIHSDDGARVSIGASPQTNILNTWTTGAPQTTYDTQSVNLTAGQPMPITIDYREKTGSAEIQFYVKSGPGISGYAVVPSTWLSNGSRPLPTGWQLNAADGPRWQRAIYTSSSAILVDPEGDTAEYKWNGTGFVPPAGEDGILSAGGTFVTLSDSDGYEYVFDAAGALSSVKAATDDTKPSTLQYNWSGTPANLTSITDPVSARSINLIYQGGACPTPPSGYYAPPPGMLCKVSYWDSTETDLYYSSTGNLVRVDDPGAEVTQYAYDAAGRMSVIADPLATDAVAAGVRSNSDPYLYTYIAYDSSNRATSVMAPKANTADAGSPIHSYTYNGLTTKIVSSNTATDRQVNFGIAGDKPVVADWNNDGTPSIGLYRPSTGMWYLSNSNTTPAVNVSNSSAYGGNNASFGNATDLPVVGDWNGDGTATIGIYRPSTATWYLSNSTTAPVINAQFVYGTATDVPVAGDWDHNGTTTVGYYRPSDGTWHLRNTNSPGADDITFAYQGGTNLTPIVGDWDGDLYPTTGVAGSGTFSVRNANTTGGSDNRWVNLDNTGTPVAGDWDGNGTTSPGTFNGGVWSQYDPSTSVRTVVVDGSGRLTSSTNSTGQVDQTTWDIPDRPMTETDAAGLVSTHRYDYAGRETDTYGPAPAACYTGTLPNGSCTNPAVPHSSTGYDGNLRGLVGTYYPNASFYGTPKAHDTMFGASGTDTINRDWPTPPISGMTAPWSARYTGEIYLSDAGNYSFTVWAKSAVQVWVDDVRVANLAADPGGTLTQSPVITFYNGTAATKHRLRIDVAESTGGAAVQLFMKLPLAGSYVLVGNTLTNGSIGPRLSLETTTVTDDSAMPSGASATLTEYAKPELGLPTASVVDPSGLALRTETTYEPASSTTYFRRATRRLPAAASAGINTTAYAYYGGTDTPANPCGGGTAPVQGGQVKTSTDATPASGTAIVREQVYDAAGRVLGTQVQGDGAGWTCNTYDTRGRTSRVSIPAFGGAAARTIRYDYAVGGNPLVTAVCDDNVAGSPVPLATGPCSGKNGVIMTTVDLLGRVVSYTDVWGKTTATSYDPASNVIQTSGPQGTIKVVNDSAGRPLQERLNGTLVASASYDNAGRFDSATYANGTSLVSISGTSGGRDVLGQQLKQNWNFTGGAVAQDQVVKSQAGTVTDELIDGVDSHVGNNFVYDGAGRLTSAWTPGHAETYTFNGTGGCGASATAGKNTNRTGFTDTAGSLSYSYCYDNADRLTSTTDPSVGTIRYDAHGNTTSIFGETHAYDAADRHTSTSKASTTVTYLRDATDRIVQRSVNGTVAARYLSGSGGDAPDATMDSSSTLVESTLSLPGGVLLTTRAAGNVWSYPNLHGDVIATANQAGAKQGSTISYDPYGLVVSGTSPDNSAGSMDYGWLGAHQRGLEAQTGLQSVVEMGARQYAPSIGRFLEVDPVEGGSANDYDYVAGDPINHFDLDGTRKCSWRHPAGCAKKVTKTVKRVAKKAVKVAKVGAKIVRSGAKLAGRCARNLETCGTNIKIALSPLVTIGLTSVMFWGAATACGFGGPAGCAVGIPILGGAGVAGLYATYQHTKALWWGNDRSKHYEPL